MKLYSYVVKHDTGFAPNPFWGYCTLANCKPVIRRTAKVGDWIVGLSPKSDGNRLIYAMKVEEIVSFDEYYRDNRFVAKIPYCSTGKVVHKCGDNIYKPLPNGGYQQLQSMHSKGTCKDRATNKKRDLGGKYVLISKTFCYFGSRPLNLPEFLGNLKVGRAHKCRFTPDIITVFISFIKHQKAGINARPTLWHNNDKSWKITVP